MKKSSYRANFDARNYLKSGCALVVDGMETRNKERCIHASDNARAGALEWRQVTEMMVMALWAEEEQELASERVVGRRKNAPEIDRE